MSAIRAILAFCGDVIYWGGDYRGTVDAMHFEIDVAPGDPALPALVQKIQGGGIGGQQVGIQARANGRLVCAESAGGASLIANRSAVGPWETFTMIDRGGGTVAIRAAANNMYVCAENGGGVGTDRQPILARSLGDVPTDHQRRRLVQPAIAGQQPARVRRGRRECRADREP